jgi:hypothetical protein
MRTTTQPSHHFVRKSVAFGGVAGFVGGLVMIPFMMLIAMMAGMPANTMPVAMGMAFGVNQNDAMMTGLGMHLLTSTLIGVIFGAVTGSVDKLKITRFRKGIGEGLITGMIAFGVLFIPISMMVMPPVLVQMMMQMNPNITQQQAMEMLQQGTSMMIGLGVLEHLVYGAVLGAVASVLVLRIRPSKDQQGHSYVCSSCKRSFGTAEQREEHIRRSHHGVAA